MTEIEEIKKEAEIEIKALSYIYERIKEANGQYALAIIEGNIDGIKTFLRILNNVKETS